MLIVCEYYAGAGYKYHLREGTELKLTGYHPDSRPVALCGLNMQGWDTKIPVKAYANGFGTWCAECARKAGIP